MCLHTDSLHIHRLKIVTPLQHIPSLQLPHCCLQSEHLVSQMGGGSFHWVIHKLTHMIKVNKTCQVSRSFASNSAQAAETRRLPVYHLKTVWSPVVADIILWYYTGLVNDNFLVRTSGSNKWNYDYLAGKCDQCNRLQNKNPYSNLSICTHWRPLCCRVLGSGGPAL